MLNKQWKKIFMLVIFILSVSVMVACSGDTSSSTNTEGNSGDNSTDTQGDTEEQERTLLVGTDAETPPFVYFDKGEIVGFDVDLIIAILDEAGLDYEIENVGWEPLFTSIENGEVDIGISSITITDERLETFDFADPYFESKNMILSKKDSGITSATDLEGKKIGAQNGTTGQIAIEKIIGENNPSLLKYETLGVAFMALKNGEIEAVITDNTVADEYVKNNPKDNLEAISDEENFEPEYYGIMLKKDNELIETINEAQKAIIENGTYTKIYEEWFGSTPDLDILKELSTK